MQTKEKSKTRYVYKLDSAAKLVRSPMVYDTAYIDSFMSRVLPSWFGSQVNTKEFPNKGGVANTNGLESYFYVEIHKSQT